MKKEFSKLFGSKLNLVSTHNFCFHDNCSAVIEDDLVILAVPAPIPLDLKAEMFNCYNMDKIGNNQPVTQSYIKPTIEQLNSIVSSKLDSIKKTNDEINEKNNQNNDDVEPLNIE